MNNKRGQRKEIDYTIADNSIDWMKRSPSDLDLYDDGGPDMEFSFADGYGFWCFGKCADNKKKSGVPPSFGAAKKAYQAQQSAKQLAAITAASKDDGSTQKLLDTINAPDAPSDSSKGAKADKPAKGSNTMIYVGVGLGILILGGAVFMYVNRKK